MRMPWILCFLFLTSCSSGEQEEQLLRDLVEEEQHLCELLAHEFEELKEKQEDQEDRLEAAEEEIEELKRRLLFLSKNWNDPMITTKI